MTEPDSTAGGAPPHPPLAIRLFGPFEVRLNGAPLRPLRSRKGQWLLALLTLRHDVEVERAWLAALLWPEGSERQALVSLRSSLTDLRQSLGPEAERLRSPTPHTLSLDLSGADVDVIPFDAAIARGDEASLQEAIALHRGPLLEGCAEEWVLEERERREQAYLRALERLAEGALAAREWAEAERYLRLAVTAEPLREGAQRALMQALAGGGSYSAAAQVYQELQRLLHQELNTQPDPETEAFFQQLRAETRGKAALGSRLSALGEDGGKSRAERRVLAVAESREPRAESRSVATLTFLLTDIVGSTRHWLDHPDAMRHALDRHDALAAAVITQHDGTLVKQRGEGDSLFAVFARASDAVAAALEIQRALAVESWPAETPLQVRMALHTGEAELREGDYYGPVVNHCARLRAVGHGGQILLSQTTAALVSDDLPRLPVAVGLRELGVHRLKDLQRPEPIFQLAHPDLPAEFPPLRSLEVFAHNLPVQLTSFIGREGQITEVKRLLASTPLLTLTGAGGCGKTRLALQVAAELLGGSDAGGEKPCPDGVWLVELAALSDPALVPQTIASVFGVREEPHRPLTATLADALRARALLLVLDNCEHLLPACAGLAETLLQHCPHLRILATSREGLRIAGETTYRVPSLSMPDMNGSTSMAMLTQCEAAQLFVERATAAVPSFTLNDQNAGAVAQVCRRLDGIPLAIELAAARVKVLSVEKIAERLDDRFRLLTGGSRTALPRQQTLRALIDWSYHLLPEPEQLLLRRLSVFAGRWLLEAAEAVCAGEGIEEWEVLNLLTALVEKSLVVYEEGEGEAQYRLLETIRQYARDRLMETKEEASVRGRHRDWFLALAEQAAPELRGPRQAKWLDRLESEHDNLRLALAWCRAEGTGAGAEVRLAGALAWFWTMRCYLSEGRQCLEAALSRSMGTPSSFRVRALLGAGWLAEFAGDFAGSVSVLQAGLDLARATGDPEGMAMALSGLAMWAFQVNDREQATALAEESLVRARETGDPWLIGFCLHILGVVVRMSEDLERATTLFQDSLVLMRQVGDRWGMMFVVLGVGGVAQAQGDYEPARRAYQEALALNQEMKDGRGMAWCLQCLAEVAAAQGRPERGARLMGAAEGLLDAIGGSWPSTYVASRERAMVVIRTALGDETATAAWAAGRAMPLEGTIAYALEPYDASSSEGG